MADLNAIVKKIQALLQKTTGNGCTEAEMLAAVDKASAMKDTYDVTDADVQLTKEEAVTMHADAPDLKDPHKIKWRLCYGVGQFCNVQIYRMPHESGLTVVGMPSDVQLAVWLLDSLADFVFGDLYAHLIGCCAPQGERQIIIRSFTAACCDRIADRLLELVERSKAARTSNGRELVVVKEDAIKAYMKDHSIHLACGSGYSPKNSDAAAVAAGRAAGNRATFGRPVSGAAGVLRIGHN